MDESLNEALSRMIFSASGWRSVFAEDEESPKANISPAGKTIAAIAAKVFSDCLPIEGAVIVGRDTRPTGEAIADEVILSLLASGREVRYVGIAAAPEIMAFARKTAFPTGNTTADNAEGGKSTGFIYISASHNPIGHNGLKFGRTDGGVLQANEAAALLAAFNSFVAGGTDKAETEKEVTKKVFSLLEGVSDEDLANVYAKQEENKKEALAAYAEFTAGVISGFGDKSEHKKFFDSLRKGLEKWPLAIAADFNGSARTLSIDRDFFSSLGVRFYSINDKPGEIVHRIVPEGESLDACRAFVEETHSKDPSLLLGYMPDCDGDRGNLVIWDDGLKRARILEAQEVFALACVAELASLVYNGELKYNGQGKALTKVAVAVNDPTSCRIDIIAQTFGVDVFRAEVGEANVVGLARSLREQGYTVRILGEGSAGGTITHPSAVRDPLDTLGAILKLLTIRNLKENKPGLFEVWCRLSGKADTYREDFSLVDIIASLPAYFTTGAYTEDALLKIKTTDHALLKTRYQKIFLRDWEEKKESLLYHYGIEGWEAIAYNGTRERKGIQDFGEAGQGGLKILFLFSMDNKKAACIWMRGSLTEPIFRVMADAPDREMERMLIEWQRRMVLEADSLNVG